MQPLEETPTMRSADQATNVTKPNDATTTYQVVEVPVQVCGDGLDNDDDSEVDEDRRATTFSPTTPTVLIDEDHKQQLSIDGLKQPSEENGHSDDKSNEDSEEKEHKDED
jgi:hypothetical protein